MYRQRADSQNEDRPSLPGPRSPFGAYVIFVCFLCLAV